MKQVTAEQREQRWRALLEQPSELRPNQRGCSFCASGIAGSLEEAWREISGCRNCTFDLVLHGMWSGYGIDALRRHWPTLDEMRRALLVRLLVRLLAETTAP